MVCQAGISSRDSENKRPMNDMIWPRSATLAGILWRGSRRQHSPFSRNFMRLPERSQAHQRRSVDRQVTAVFSWLRIMCFHKMLNSIRLSDIIVNVAFHSFIHHTFTAHRLDISTFGTARTDSVVYVPHLLYQRYVPWHQRWCIPVIANAIGRQQLFLRL